MLVEELPDGRQGHQELTRRLGDGWFKEGKIALLRIPSVPSPQSFNFLLNPLYPDARKIGVVESTWPSYDQRLFRLRK
jgi:hypothetical protein